MKSNSAGKALVLIVLDIPAATETLVCQDLVVVPQTGFPGIGVKGFTTFP